MKRRNALELGKTCIYVEDGGRTEEYIEKRERKGIEGRRGGRGHSHRRHPSPLLTFVSHKRHSQLLFVIITSCRGGPCATTKLLSNKRLGPSLQCACLRVKSLLQRSFEQRIHHIAQRPPKHLPRLVECLPVVLAQRLPSLRVQDRRRDHDLSPRRPVVVVVNRRDVLKRQLQVQQVRQRARVHWLWQRRDLRLDDEALVLARCLIRQRHKQRICNHLRPGLASILLVLAPWRSVSPNEWVPFWISREVQQHLPDFLDGGVD